MNIWKESRMQSVELGNTYKGMLLVLVQSVMSLYQRENTRVTLYSE